MNSATRHTSILLSAVAAAAMLLAVSACSAAPADDSARPLNAHWSSYGLLMSDPLVVDDVVIAYMAGTESFSGREEHVVALDVRTGEERWRQRALPGLTSRGMAHRPAIVEHAGEMQVAFLAPPVDGDARSWMRLLIVDARTGEPIDAGVTESQVWAQRPVACGADDVCLSGFQPGAVESEQMLRYDREAQRLVPATGADVAYVGHGAEHMAGNISITAEGDVQYGEDGKVRWQRTYREVFGGSADPGGARAWIDVDDAPLLLAGYGASDLGDEAETVVKDLRRAHVTAVDREDGSALWRLDGVSPCAATENNLEIFGDVVPLCRFSSGTALLEWNGDTVTGYGYDDIDQTMLGVDVTTGEIRWERPLDDSPMNVSHTGDSTGWASGDRLIVAEDGRAHQVDPATGDATPLPRDTTLLCLEPGRLVTLESIWAAPWFQASQSYTACDTSGDPVDSSRISARTLRLAGHDLEHPVVLNLTGGVTAYLPE